MLNESSMEGSIYSNAKKMQCLTRLCMETFSKEIYHKYY